MTPSLVDSSQISTKRFHCSTTCRNLEPHEVYNTTHAQCCEGYDRLNDKVLIDNILLDSSSSCEFYKYIRKMGEREKTILNYFINFIVLYGKRSLSHLSGEYHVCYCFWRNSRHYLYTFSLIKTPIRCRITAKKIIYWLESRNFFRCS